ncbi:unnamed protein product [Polarella glacialis]|uniref:Fungal lipase-type domain-containing protein n=2 Tax=Polarella glacialis TaxID=89957 RepID=A0A813EXN4_POLGL|nr:unnamed protein product [Polarella glacialis]
MGGVIASMCALDFASFASESTGVEQLAPIVYLFGSPQPGNAAFRDVYEALVPNTVRLSTPFDLITTLPMGSEYRPVGREVWMDDAGGHTFAMSWAMQDILPERNSLSHHRMLEYCSRMNKAFHQQHGQDFPSAWRYIPSLQHAFQTPGLKPRVPAQADQVEQPEYGEP